jgi:asparagine synthase (glutamine-hydrolysing)
MAWTRRYLDAYAASLVPEWIEASLGRQLVAEQRRRLLSDERDRRFSSPARHIEHLLLSPPEASPQPAGWPVAMWRPFADRRLHEFLLAIPPDQKYEPHPESDDPYAGSKWLSRRAMRGVVPDFILDRTTRTRFDSVFEREVASNWSVYAAAFGPTARPEVVARGYVDQDRFWVRLNALRGGERFSPLELGYVMRVAWLETWLRGLKQPRPDLVTVRPTESVKPLDIAIPEPALAGASRSGNPD